MEFVCSVCHESGSERYLSLDCLHAFCEDCKQTVDGKDECPVCGENPIKTSHWSELIEPGKFETEHKMQVLRSKCDHLDQMELRYERYLLSLRKEFERAIREAEQEYEKGKRDAMKILDDERKERELTQNVTTFFEMCKQNNLRPRDIKENSDKFIGKAVSGMYVDVTPIEQGMELVSEIEMPEYMELPFRSFNIDINSNGDKLISPSDSGEVFFLRSGCKTATVLNIGNNFGISKCRFGPDGIIYVCNYRQNAIFKLSADARTATKQCGCLSNDNEHQRLAHWRFNVAVNHNNGNLVFLEEKTSLVRVFNQNLEVVNEFHVLLGCDPPDDATYLAVGTRNEILICYEEATDVIIYGEDGTKIGSINTGPYKIEHPQRVFSDNLGNYYVFGNQHVANFGSKKRVMKFDERGVLERIFELPERTSLMHVKRDDGVFVIGGSPASKIRFYQKKK